MKMFRRIGVSPYKAGAMLTAGVAALALGVGTSGASTSTPKLAMIVAANDQNAFQEMADGAIVAAHNFHDSLTSLAPASTTDDATVEVQEFQTAETSSPQGIGIMTTDPPDSATVEAQAEAAKIPVVSVDACSLPTANVPTCVANNNTGVGLGIGKVLCQKIGKKSGEIVVGDDIPQLGLLGLRITGMETAIKACDPNATFSQINNVTAGPTTNEQAWTALVAANPNALAYIAPGDQDAVSFVDIENQTHKHYLVIACDVDPTAINGVKDGDILGLGDPQHFLKGYLAMYVLDHNARTGKLITGWWNPGSSTITKSNINAIIKREKSNANRYAYYKALLAKEIKSPNKYILPLSQAGMN
jgi:ABC-type sugar transport system substrate-binding protein